MSVHGSAAIPAQQGGIIRRARSEMYPSDRPGAAEGLFLHHLALIERVSATVCARSGLSGPEIDDFASLVKMKIIEDRYAILQKFEGRSSLKTYLQVVIHRLFLDYRIGIWGKWRPSAEAKRAGGVAVLLDQLMTRDGHTFDEACELLKSKHQVRVSRSELERIAGTLPQRVGRRFESEYDFDGIPATTSGPDETMAASAQQATANRVSSVMRALLTKLETQDRLVISLRFQDGRTVADIARILRVQQNALYRRLDRLLKQLRDGFEREGIEPSAVSEMLKSPSVCLQWTVDDRDECVSPGPSPLDGARECP